MGNYVSFPIKIKAAPYSNPVLAEYQQNLLKIIPFTFKPVNVETMTWVNECKVSLDKETGRMTTAVEFEGGTRRRKLKANSYTHRMAGLPIDQFQPDVEDNLPENYIFDFDKAFELLIPLIKWESAFKERMLQRFK